MHEILRPHCWLDAGPCPNRCAAAHHDRVVYGRQALHGPWSGWRLTDREIITPERDRMPRDLLRFLIAREKRVSRR